jgi:small neutral amino acid transporter SnatA (MarC family)
MIQAAKSILLVVSAVSDRGSDRRQPLLLVAHQRLRTGDAQTACPPHRDRQLHIIDRFLRHRIHVLSFFGISLPVVQVGGGLIVIATGRAMLKQKEENDRDKVGRKYPSADVLGQAFYPLTLPLTVGPGSISIAITLRANEPRHLGANLLMILAAAIGCALLAITIYLCYGFADRLAVVIGTTGMNVVLKLSSFLLVCIGVEIFWNGLSKLLSSLPHVVALVVLL